MITRRIFMWCLAALTVPLRPFMDKKPRQCLGKLHTAERRLRAFRQEDYRRFRIVLESTLGKLYYIKNPIAVEKDLIGMKLVFRGTQAFNHDVKFISIGLIDDEGYQLGKADSEISYAATFYDSLSVTYTLWFHL